VVDGYVQAGRGWKAGDEILLRMDMPVRMVAADPNVKADEGKRAVCRGPLVYCMEETDNADVYDSAGLTEDVAFTETWRQDLLGGVTTIKGSNGITFVPYYTWDNREAGRMKVWIDLN
jgi:DUF1680 family protein